MTDVGELLEKGAAALAGAIGDQLRDARLAEAHMIEEARATHGFLPDHYWQDRYKLERTLAAVLAVLDAIREARRAP